MILPTKIHSLIKVKIQGKEVPWMVNALDGYVVSLEMEDRYNKINVIAGLGFHRKNQRIIDHHTSKEENGKQKEKEKEGCVAFEARIYL